MKYNEELRDQIVSIIKTGVPIETAVEACGIGKSTYYQWQQEHPDFADAIKEARAISEVALLQIIRKASELSWQSAAWILERRFPATYGKKDRLEMTGKDGEPMQSELSINVVGVKAKGE